MLLHEAGDMMEDEEAYGYDDDYRGDEGDGVMDVVVEDDQDSAAAMAALTVADAEHEAQRHRAAASKSSAPSSSSASHAHTQPATSRDGKRRSGILRFKDKILGGTKP